MPQPITPTPGTPAWTAPAGTDPLNETEIVASIQQAADRDADLRQTLDLPLAPIVKDIDGTAGVPDVDLAGASYWGPNASTMSMQSVSTVPSVAGKKVFYNIGAVLQQGGTLTRVEALVQPGAGHTVGMVLEVVRREAAVPFTGPPANPAITVLATSAASSGTSNQALDSGALAESTDNDGLGRSWGAYVSAGDGGTSDIVWGIRVHWTPTKVTNR